MKNKKNLASVEKAMTWFRNEYSDAVIDITIRTEEDKNYKCLICDIRNTENNLLASLEFIASDTDCCINSYYMTNSRKSKIATIWTAHDWELEVTLNLKCLLNFIG